MLKASSNLLFTNKYTGLSSMINNEASHAIKPGSPVQKIRALQFPPYRPFRVRNPTPENIKII